MDKQKYNIVGEENGKVLTSEIEGIKFSIGKYEFFISEENVTGKLCTLCINDYKTGMLLGKFKAGVFSDWNSAFEKGRELIESKGINYPVNK